jgi:hypothetical protein
LEDSYGRVQEAKSRWNCGGVDMPEQKTLEILEEKLECLYVIKQLTEKEYEIIKSQDEKDIFKLEDILVKKSECMDRIDDLDREYRSIWPKKTEEIKWMECSIKDLLFDIIEVDTKKNSLMEAELKSIKHDLKDVRENIRANKAYGYEEQNTMFINEKK